MSQHKIRLSPVLPLHRPAQRMHIPDQHIAWTAFRKKSVSPRIRYAFPVSQMVMPDNQNPLLRQKLRKLLITPDILLHPMRNLQNSPIPAGIRRPLHRMDLRLFIRRLKIKIFLPHHIPPSGSHFKPYFRRLPQPVQYNNYTIRLKAYFMLHRIIAAKNPSDRGQGVRRLPCNRI